MLISLRLPPKKQRSDLLKPQVGSPLADSGGRSAAQKALRPCAPRLCAPVECAPLPKECQQLLFAKSDITLGTRIRGLGWVLMVLANAFALKIGPTN
jgi:hypothetical protein